MPLAGDSAPWVYTLSVPTTALFASARRLILVMALSFAAALAATAVAVFLLSSRMTKPLQDLSASFVKMAAGDLEVRVPASGGVDEYAALERDFNAFAEGLAALVGGIRSTAASIELPHRPSPSPWDGAAATWPTSRRG